MNPGTEPASPLAPSSAPAALADGEPAKDIVSTRLQDPFRWLALGWRDLMAAKGIGIF